MQRLLERRVVIKQPEPVEPSWWRWRFWWIGGAALPGGIAGAILWLTFHRLWVAAAAPLGAVAVAVCVIAWLRLALLRAADE